jgi:hypothetical protein
MKEFIMCNEVIGTSLHIIWTNIEEQDNGKMMSKSINI